jgi:hypothetical protein
VVVPLEPADGGRPHPKQRRVGDSRGEHDASCAYNAASWRFGRGRAQLPQDRHSGGGRVPRAAAAHRDTCEQRRHERAQVRSSSPSPMPTSATCRSGCHVVGHGHRAIRTP